MGTLDLNLLVAFCAVAERAGFTAAAVLLGLPKSSVSRAVGALERELGVTLFHRTTRRVALTSAGAAFYEEVAPRLAGLQRATSEMPERDEEPAGLLRVTTLADLAREVVGEVVARLALRYPRLRIQVVLTERVVDLAADRIDAAVRLSGSRLRDSSLVARRVGRVRMGIYAAPAYLRRHGQPRQQAQLAHHEWASIESSESRLVPPHVEPRIRCNDGGTLLAILREGACLGILPIYLAEHDVGAGRLTRVLPTWEPLSGDIWLVHAFRDRAPKKLTAFRDELVATLGRRPLLTV